MSFTLVSALEKKRLVFVVVPEKWVNGDNILFWPKHLLRWEVEKLRSDPNSSPESNWKPQECSVKLQNIKTFENGLELEQSFVEFTDTEAEERFLKTRNEEEKSKTKIVLSVPGPSTMASNSIYENLFAADASHSPFNILQVVRDEVNNETNSNTGTNQNMQITPTPLAVSSVVDEVPLVDEEGFDVHQVLHDAVAQVIEKRCHELENKFQKHFKELDLRISQNSVKLDQILKILSSRSSEGATVNVNSSAASVALIDETGIDFKFPICDPDLVIEFELKLSRDLQFKNLLIKDLCKFGGTSKNEQADKIIYAVFDYLFDPELITKFSWTGASKSQNSKRCFQKMENIVDLVYDVLSRADSRHTKNRNESLIRDKVLKHTNQRLNRKRKINKTTEIEKKHNIPTNNKVGDENMVDNAPVDIMLEDITTEKQSVDEESGGDIVENGNYAAGDNNTIAVTDATPNLQ